MGSVGLWSSNNATCHCFVDFWSPAIAYWSKYGRYSTEICRRKILNSISLQKCVCTNTFSAGPSTQLEWPQGMPDMLTHVHALNPFHLSISPAWELLNQHKNPTHPSSTCSTSIVQKPKRTRYYPSTVQPAFVLAVCSSHDETLLLQIELLKVKCQKFIAGYHKHQWAIDHALSWAGNNGQRERVFQYSALGFHLVSRLFPNCRPDWESDGDAVLGWQLCCVPAQSLQNKSQRFASPQHNLLQYWEEIVETKQ